MPNEINAARFNERLSRELAIDGAPAPILAPEIQPSIILENERPENLYWQGERRYSMSLSLSGVSGEYYYAAIWNPAASKVLVIVEKFAIGVTSTTYVDFGPLVYGIVASLSGRATYCLDTRVPQNALGWPCTSMPYVGSDPGTGGIANFGRMRIGTNEMHTVDPLGYVLTPGNGFGIFLATVNIGVAGYLFFRERNAERGELST